MTEVTFECTEVRPFQLQPEALASLLRWQSTSVNQISETASPVAHPARAASSTSAWDLLRATSVTDATESGLSCVRPLLLGNAPIDWEAVLRLGDEHGTSSLMYRNLSRLGDVVPSATLAALRQGYETNIHKSLFLARELIRILDCLDALGIEVIPYKGAVLSEAYYGDMALRRSGDMDLFVRKRDVARIKSAVRDLGYTQHVPVRQDAEEDYIAAGYEWTFDSPAGRGLLELQWALQPRFYAVDFDMDGLFERAVSATVAGRRVKTPSPEDLLLVLSVHAAKHVWGRLIWLCDIAQILKQETLNWDSLRLRTRELGIERILHTTLRLANRLLAMPIPAPIENAILADGAARRFADEIAINLVRGISYDVEQVSYFHLMMRLRERKADRLRFLTRLTFTPGPGEWDAIRLPRLLFPLYRVVRLARLAARFVRG
ncbi:MAG TPA: nucleotidyltransferase family protein [Candidatus Acidoferrum sp.]|jgi:hypothetical protein|nr:nucleotidyltransferase family protein [Candidatus Acidoferrum sp.]